MPGPLERDDIIDGLRELVSRLRRAGVEGASIQIIGGAALRLSYFSRPSTVDIDARYAPREPIETFATAIAEERNWPRDWLNDKASQFIPGWGSDVEWRPLLVDESVVIAVASAEALLAMKLNALQGRSGRDGDDVARLLSLTGTTTVEQAEEVYSAYYPGDAFSERTVAAVERMLLIGLPARPDDLDPPLLG